MNILLQRSNTILYCKNWFETMTFYKEIFRFPISLQKGWFVEFRLTDTTYLSIADEKRASIHSVEGQGVTLSWQVADIYEAHLGLQRHGIDIGEVIEKWGSKLFYLHDPEGHRIELWQPLP